MTTFIDHMPETAAALCFHHSIPRGMVHRAAISEVFLTDSAQDSDKVYLAAQLPRNHSYFSDHRGTSTNYDSLLLVEVFRQVAIFYAHEYCEVPKDQKFIFGSAEYSILDSTSLYVGNAPGHCIIEASVSERKIRNDALTGLVLEMTAWVDGKLAARETMAYQWMPALPWSKIRERGRGTLGLPPQHQVPSSSSLVRLRPEAVGRNNPRNSILAEPRMEDGVLSALTIIDTEHPSLFDHALDHVPGMLQFEACRQIAMAAASAVLGLDTNRMLMSNFDVRFTKFAEFEIDTIATATSVRSIDDGTVSVDVVLTQVDETICEGTVSLRLCGLDLGTMLR